MSDAVGEQKLLSELRVTELKQELEKRNLDKNGIKIILTDRLEKALLADGHDPATYLFRVNEPVVPSDTNAKQMSPSATPVDTDGEGTLHISENGNAEGDSHETSAQMETDAAPTTKDNDKKVNELNDSKELIIDDQNTGAAATNDEEMLEDPLVDVPAETTPAPAKSADNKITAQPSVKTPVQAPANDDKEKDVASRSIWVRGLTSATKAADLKVLCTQYGKVVRAKIYTSKKQSTSACYGYVTMADSAAADKAAAAMHKTQIKGRIISVEKADKSKVPAVKSATAATTKKDGATSESKRDTEKKGKDEDSKAKVAGEKSQTDAKGKSTAASATSKREETRSSDRKREDKEKRTSTGDRRDSERPRASDAKRDARRSAAREPRRGAQRTISAARRFPIRGVSSYSLRGRITRPGDRGAYMSSVRRPEAMSQRDLLTMLRHKEEEHRRREAEIEKERALERERERIRFEREQLEKERLQLQLQAALQQQKLAAMNSSRTKDTYAPSSRGSRHAEYRSSRDSRAEKISSSTSHHRSVADTHRSTTESRSRRGGSTDRADRDRSEHKHTASGAASRERSRHESYGTSSRSTRPASYATTTKEYDRAYASSRGTHSYSNGRGSSSYYGTSRDAYSASARPTYGSSSTWVSGGGSGLGGHSSSTSSWTRGAAGPGGWASFGSTGGASSGVRYDYDKYQQRF